MFERLLKAFVIGLFIYFSGYYAVEYVLSRDDKFSRFVLLIVFVSSVITFFMYGIDKWKAEREKWRIKEKTLLIWGVCGGAWGALVGMVFYRHKIRKWYFWFVNIFGAVLPIILIALVRGDLSKGG